jgi:thioredoxin-dependent peroxiredoxin
MPKLLALALLLATFNSIAADLSVGDDAPDFSAAADDGKIWNSADHLGKTIIVVYFYPADMTGGCTKQACAFRDDQDALAAKDVAVIGVSGDSVRNHGLFKKVHSLNFPLLADEDGAVAKAFGVPLRKGGSIERTIEGKLETLTRGVSAARWTFVIGKDGKIAHKNTKVNAAKDSKIVMAVIDSLKQ